MRALFDDDHLFVQVNALRVCVHEKRKRVCVCVSRLSLAFIKQSSKYIVKSDISNDFGWSLGKLFLVRRWATAWGESGWALSRLIRSEYDAPPSICVLDLNNKKSKTKAADLSL